MYLTPKIILCIACEDVIFGNTHIKPYLTSLHVSLKTVLRIAFKVGHVKAVLGQLVYFGQDFPRVANGFFLKSMASIWAHKGRLRLTLK